MSDYQVTNYGICGECKWHIVEKERLLKEIIKREKTLRLLLDWAVECGFGYDNIPEEYERYEHEIKDMDYTEGLIYIAEREVEKNE